ncbi:MAG: MarR family transcriptional regulator [Ktedonobacterales bacterium]|nr:MarR family transcriptional regulator [Ktedonobacterales bacterium]
MMLIMDSCAFLLVQISQAQRQFVAETLDGLGLHPGQELILLLLAEEDGQTQMQLAQRRGVEPPTITKMMQRMAEQGMITRQSDDEDGRVMRVYLSEAGRALIPAIQALWHAVEERLLQRISEPERLLLRRLLQQMHTNQEGMSDAP